MGSKNLGMGIAGRLAALLVVALCTVHPGVEAVVSDEEARVVGLMAADLHELELIDLTRGLEEAMFSKNVTKTTTEESDEVASQFKSKTREKVGHLLRQPSKQKMSQNETKAASGAEMVKQVRANTNAAQKELGEKTAKSKVRENSRKKAHATAAAKARQEQTRKASPPATKKKSGKPTNDPRTHEVKNKRSLAILNARQAKIDQAKAKKAQGLNADLATNQSDVRESLSNGTAGVSSTQNKQIVELRNAIQSFEAKVKTTLDETEKKLKQRIAQIESQHEKLSKDEKAANNTGMATENEMLDFTSMLQLAEKPVDKLVADIDALHQKYMGTYLKKQEEAAEQKAEKAAKVAEETRAKTQRAKFIAFEVQKAKAAANLKIVNPLEGKLKDMKATFEDARQAMLNDRKMAFKFLNGANQAASTGGKEDDKVATDDAEADKYMAVARFSSNQASKAETKYTELKAEYGALQTRLEQENSKHIEKAAMEAEEKAAAAFDSAEAKHAKNVAQAAAGMAKKAVDDEANAAAAVAGTKSSNPCKKCKAACKTQECQEWCGAKWCKSVQ